MARAKTEVAGKTAKAKEHPAVTRIKKLEKRVAKLEKEKEEERRHAKLWRGNQLKEHRDFVNTMAILVRPHHGNEPSKATPKTTKRSAQVI